MIGRGVLERVVRRGGAAAAAGARRRRRARAAGGAALALRLEPSAATTRSSAAARDAYQATERYRERFGDHAVFVLVRGRRCTQLVLTDNLGRLLGLEGCLSGNMPDDQQAPGGAAAPCARARAHKPVQGRLRAGHVHQRGRRRDPGPAPGASSAARRSAGRRRRPRRRASSRAAQGRRRRSRSGSPTRPSSSSTRSSRATCCSSALQVRARADGLPRLDDPDFVSALVFDPTRGATTPKARFAYLFPNSNVGADPGAAEART